MRADRLVAILLLLQQRQQVTAAEVAEELEISERTARRDLDALAVAGVPVYSVQGRGGGWRLAGGGRTDLSGLTAPEARALFQVASQHGRGAVEVRAALRKLARALPEPMRHDAVAAATSVAIDPTAWGRRPGERPSPQLLDVVQAAVIRRRRLAMAYVDRRGTATERTVDPLGLGAKGETWYLVADTAEGRRTFRVDRMRSAEILDEEATRPADFDIAEVWQQTVEQFDLLRTPIVAHGRVEPPLVGHLRSAFGTRLSIGAASDDWRVPIEVRGHDVRSLAAELAGYAPWMELDDPPELQGSLALIGRALLDRYGDPGAVPTQFGAGGPSR